MKCNEILKYLFILVDLYFFTFEKIHNFIVTNFVGVVHLLHLAEGFHAHKGLSERSKEGNFRKILVCVDTRTLN